MLDTAYGNKLGKYTKIFLVFLDRLNIKPNHLTFLALILGILASISYYFSLVPLSFFLLALSGICDILDGSLARYQNTKSSLGAYLDLIFDRFVEAVFVFFVFLKNDNLSILCILFYILVILNFSSFLISSTLFKNNSKKHIYQKPGLLERSETFIFFFVLILFPSLSFISFIVFDALLLITFTIRFLENTHLLINKEEAEL